MMTFSRPACPTCGRPASGTLERVYGWAGLIRKLPENTFEYDGETKIDWNGQRTVLDRNGFVTLHCDNNHTWKALRDEH